MLRTSSAVEIFLVHVAPSNQKCAASSRIHWIGTSTSELAERRYGLRSSMKFEEYRNPWACRSSSVFGLKSHEGERYPTTSTPKDPNTSRPFTSSCSSS